jgi:glycosidase
MNLASSHDSPRLLTAFANKDKYKYNCKPQENKHFKTNRPEEATLGKVRLFLLHQFTFVGSPHIWNGDEMGMTGADDPDNRKPMVWPDVTFSPETNSGFSAYTYSEVPAFDHKMFEYYKSLIALRKSSPAFSNGHYEFLDTPASDRILAYRRTHGHTDYVVVFNNNPEMNEFQPEKGYTEPVFICGEKPVFSNKGYLLHPYSGMVLKIVRNP